VASKIENLPLMVSKSVIIVLKMTAKCSLKRIFEGLILLIYILATSNSASTTKNPDRSFAHLFKVKAFEGYVSKYAEENIIYPNHSFYLAKYGRTQSINFYLMIRKPIYKFYVRIFLKKIKRILKS
jgi:hypothetical protein